MAKWDREPCAGDWRNQPDLPELASTLGRTEEEVLDAYRFFPGYWDTFRKMSLNQAVIWPDEREAKGSGDFSHFVHEYEEDGVTRYAVAAWYAKHGYWVRPMTKAHAAFGYCRFVSICNVWGSCGGNCVQGWYQMETRHRNRR